MRRVPRRTVTALPRSSPTKTRPATTAASWGRAPIGVRATTAPRTSTCTRRSSPSVGTRKRAASGEKAKWRGAGGRASGTGPGPTSRSPARTPTATACVRGSTARPSAPAPTGVTVPAGGMRSAGAWAGSAAGGSSWIVAEPQPASATAAARAAADGVARRTGAGCHSVARVTDRRLLLGASLLAAAVVATGLLVERSGRVLGTATPPFVMAWGPRIDPWALCAAAVLGAIVVGAPALVRLRSPVAYVALLTAAALAAGLAVNAARSGTGAWTAIFDAGPGGSFEAKNEYLPGLPALSYGSRFFLDHFAELVPALPVNVAGHPPGLLLGAHALRLTTPARFAALCIGAAALVPALAYALARGLGREEPAARVAGLLAAASPGLLLFGVTSADAVYAALGTATAALLVGRGAAVRVAGALLLAFAAFCSWALLAAGAFAVVVVGLRDGARRALALAAMCAAAWLGLNAALAGWVGYDPIGTLRATSAVYGRSLADVRPWWFWSLGSPVAGALPAGLPLAGAWLLAARRRDAAAVALLVIIVVAAALGFTKAETERIWLPFTALACAAGCALVPARALRAVLAALVAQALLTEVLFATVW